MRQHTVSNIVVGLQPLQYRVVREVVFDPLWNKSEDAARLKNGGLSRIVACAGASI
jgi:hypothetical protein